MKRLVSGIVPLFFLLSLPVHADMILSEAPSYLWTYGCGPTAGMDLMGYWGLHGYPNLLPSTGDSYSTATVTGDIAEMAALMQTSGGWTYLSEIAPALEAYAASDGYDFTATTYGFLPWTELTAEIDAGYPLLALVDTSGSGGTNHFVPVVGYQGQDYCVYTTWSESETVSCFPYQPMGFGIDWGVGYLTEFTPVTSPPTAVPEPTTAALLMTGLMSCCWKLRRKTSGRSGG